MTRLFVLTTILGLLFSSVGHAANEKKTVKSTLEHATVFFNGAELTHSLTTILTRGDNELLVKDLSSNIDKNSVRITTTGGVLVSSYDFTVDYLPKVVTPDLVIKKWQDSLVVCKDELRAIKDNLETIEEVLKLLKSNKDISSKDKGVDVNDLIQMTAYYKTQSTQLLKERRDNEKRKGIVDEIAQRLQAQIQQESGQNNKTESFLKLQLMSPINTTGTIKIIYYTNKATWTPYYDINVTGTDKPIKITSRAKVRQTTGINWNKVKLTLSSSIPSNGKTAPLFNAWFLNYITTAPRPSVSNALQGRVAGVSIAQNTHSYKESEVKIRGFSNISNKPLIIVDGVEMADTDMSDIDPSMIKDMQVLKDASATAIYGSRGANGIILVTTKGSMNDYVARGENELNMTYNIDLPYNVEGNGKEQSINLQTYDVSAEFKYYCAPKLDTETFLLAEISDWQKLGLLSGKANVTYDGTYVGETTINASSTHEKLSLTLGTDKRVVVKREKLQDFTGKNKKFLGDDIKQEFAYKLTVKNNQNKSIKMVLKDQYPISSQKDIEVELAKETTIPTFKNEEVGVLSWEFELNSGETKEFKTSYTVKYPKNKPVNL